MAKYILFPLAVIAFAVSLFINKKVKTLMSRESDTPLDPDTPTGDSAECKRLRRIIAALDISAVVLIIIGFLVE